MAIILQILENVIFLSLLGFVVYFIVRTQGSTETPLVKGLIGVSFGLIAFLVTATPVELLDGATIDARAGPVILAGVLAGPIGGLIAASLGGLARGLIGGSFAFSGMTVFFVYAIIGIAFRHFKIVPISRVADVRSIGLIALASIGGGSAMFFLINPAERALRWLQQDLPYIMLANVLSVSLTIFVIGIALQLWEKTVENDDLNETLKLAKRAGGFGVWDFNIKSGELKWDDRSLELHGLTRSEFPGTFESWSTTVHPDDLAQSQARFAHSLENGEPFETEYRVIGKDGVIRAIKGSATLLNDQSGSPFRVIGTNLDLTELRSTEAKLMEAQSQAIQAQKFDTIGQLTGGIAHDFNNLLAIIMGNQELLKGEVVKQPLVIAEIDELIEATLEATRRGAELTQNMLAYARQARLTPVETDVNKVVRETEKWLRRTIESRIEIETVLQGGLWPALVDRVSLQNALVNLLVNARDAVEGAGKITVETSNIRIDKGYIEERRENISPGDYIMLAVTDSGHGIAADEIHQIFEPFHTTKPVGKGSGLGLSMVEGFVKQSGGAVRVYSELGVGSSFKLYFPAIRGEVGTGVQASAEPAAGPDRTTRSARILLVEDQPEVLSVLRKTLEGAGYEVVAAESGDAAFKIFEGDRDFDLVATDIVMPGERQGPRLAKDIRSLDPDICFIFLSGYASEATVHGNGLKPEDRRLMKPVSREDLLNAVDSAISGSR